MDMAIRKAPHFIRGALGGKSDSIWSAPWREHHLNSEMMETARASREIHTVIQPRISADLALFSADAAFSEESFACCSAAMT